MHVFTHVVSGALTGKTSDKVSRYFLVRIVIAFVAGNISHLFFDSIPHEEYQSEYLNQILFGELFLLGLIFVATFIRFKSDVKTMIGVSFGITGAAFLDGIRIIPGLFGWEWSWTSELIKFHSLCHGYFAPYLNFTVPVLAEFCMAAVFYIVFLFLLISDRKK